MRSHSLGFRKRQDRQKRQLFSFRQVDNHQNRARIDEHRVLIDQKLLFVKEPHHQPVLGLKELSHFLPVFEVYVGSVEIRLQVER